MSEDDLPQSRRWHESRIQSLRREVKQELEALPRADGARGRIRHALDRIEALRPSRDPDDQMRRFFFIISAIVHHEKAGGLTTKQVDSLTQMAEAILTMQGIQPLKSRLAILYGEVHQARSIAWRRSGDHWRAGWEQASGIRRSGINPPGGPGFQTIMLAQRALAAGHAAFAIDLLRTSSAGDLKEDVRGRTQAHLVRALRMTGALDEAKAVAKECLARPDLEDLTRRELLWEDLCAHVHKTQDLSAMVRSVRKGEIHYGAVYLMEAFLWTRLVQDPRWRESVQSMHGLARSKNLAPRSLGLFYVAACQVEACGDEEAPLDRRLAALGETLADVGRLGSVDKQALVLGAATRWLVSEQCIGHAALAGLEYQGLSLRLSGGASKDVLQALGDLTGAPWAARLAEAPGEVLSRDAG